MPQTLAVSQLKLMLDALQQNTVGLQTVSGAVSRSPSVPLTTGVGANQADRIYSSSITLGASATSDLDLSGVLLDIFGAAILFARIKAIICIADAGNTNNVVLGGAAANQFVGPFGAAAHTIAVKPGGFLCNVAPDAAGWVVTAGTADIFRVGNSGAGTSVLFDLILLGASA